MLRINHYVWLETLRAAILCMNFLKPCAGTHVHAQAEMIHMRCLVMMLLRRTAGALHHRNEGLYMILSYVYLALYLGFNCWTKT